MMGAEWTDGGRALDIVHTVHHKYRIEGSHGSLTGQDVTERLVNRK
jgi:hypothetical protein